MKIVVIGSKARDHAIIRSLNREGHHTIGLPGNGGVKECLGSSVSTAEITSLCVQGQPNLVIVNSEDALEHGAVDLLRAKGLVVFGPDQKCAKLLVGKADCKAFLLKHKIPRAKHSEFKMNSLDQKASAPVLSISVLTNLDAFKVLPIIYANKNGSFGQAGIELNLLKVIENKIIRPVLDALKSEDVDFRGILTFKIVTKKNEAQVLKLTPHLAGPQAQILLTFLEGQWANLFFQMAKKNLVYTESPEKFSYCLVLANAAERRKPVEFVLDLVTKSEESFILHSETSKISEIGFESECSTPLSVVGVGINLFEARARALELANKILDANQEAQFKFSDFSDEEVLRMSSSHTSNS